VILDMTLGMDALTVVTGKLATVPSKRVQAQVYKEISLALWVTVPVQKEKKPSLQPCMKVTDFSAATGQGGFDLSSGPGMR
jgi:hypothetical protein